MSEKQIKTMLQRIGRLSPNRRPFWDAAGALAVPENKQPLIKLAKSNPTIQWRLERILELMQRVVQLEDQQESLQ